MGQITRERGRTRVSVCVRETKRGRDRTSERGNEWEREKARERENDTFVHSCERDNECV